MMKFDLPEEILDRVPASALEKLRRQRGYSFWAVLLAAVASAVAVWFPSAPPTIINVAYFWSWAYPLLSSLVVFLMLLVISINDADEDEVLAYVLMTRKRPLASWFTRFIVVSWCLGCAARGWFVAALILLVSLLWGWLASHLMRAIGKEKLKEIYGL